MDIINLIKENPLLEQMSSAQEIAWINPKTERFQKAIQAIDIGRDEVADAEERLLRFAPYIKYTFADTVALDGVIESPLADIEAMKTWLNTVQKSRLQGRLMLKQDSHLAVAGSVKARGGIYEILAYAESLALQHNKINQSDNYVKFTNPEMRRFFSQYSVHVGSTGNLGLSIGIISAALGFRVYVHMSADAKKWKKDLLRSKGAEVIEYTGDYEKAVKSGRLEAQKDEKSYFVDDENSKNLFLGYAVAGRRLQAQLTAGKISVDSDHPLFVYIPCGVGGAPGGITFGLKLIFGDNVHVFFAEPTQACCMALGLITGLHDEICVQDIGLSGNTDADGLAVGRPSRLVGRVIEHLIEGEFTVDDCNLYPYMKALVDTENIFIEPSSCAAFTVPARLNNDLSGSRYLEENFTVAQRQNTTHIVWATGGSLVPDEVRAEYYNKARSPT